MAWPRLLQDLSLVAIVSDPESLITGFRAEFDALLDLALEDSPSMAELSAKLDDALAALDELLAA